MTRNSVPPNARWVRLPPTRGKGSRPHTPLRRSPRSSAARPAKPPRARDAPPREPLQVNRHLQRGPPNPSGDAPEAAALEDAGAPSAVSLDAESDALAVGTPDSGLSPAPEASPHVVAASDAMTSDAMADADGDAPDSSDARDAPDAFDAPEADVAPSAVPSACVPVNCGTHSWACWRMPNSPNSDLPNPAHYTDMGDGTVRDDVTCLLWQKTAPTDTAYTWSDAKAKCRGNPLLGGVGWRLPSRIELISIVDYTRRDPSIAVLAFPSTRPNPPYWTWSPLPSTTEAFAVSFHVGEVLHADQSTMYLARCVRGGGESQDLPAKAPADHYLIGADEVADHYTGLVWQRADSATLAPSPLQWATSSLEQSPRLRKRASRRPSVPQGPVPRMQPQELRPPRCRRMRYHRSRSLARR